MKQKITKKQLENLIKETLEEVEKDMAAQQGSEKEADEEKMKMQQDVKMAAQYIGKITNKVFYAQLLKYAVLNHGSKMDPADLQWALREVFGQTIAMQLMKMMEG